MNGIDECGLPRFPRRTVFKGAAALGAMALLAACGRSNPASSFSNTEIAVKDQRGKTLTFSRPVRRIVTLPHPAASIMIAVDRSADRLVGMHDASWNAIHDGLLGELFPEALNIAHAIAGEGFVPNVETILTLKPDVVVQWSNQGAGLIQPMENVGLAVMGVTYGLQDDVNRWFKMFAAALGKPERALEMIARNDAQLNEIEAIASKATGKPPSVLYFLRFDGGFKVANTGSYNDFYIKLVGATNAAQGLESKENFVGVDVEQVLSWDPDIVLLGNFDAAMPGDVYRNKVWKDISAVRSRRVYKVPLGGYRWDPPSHESPLMWRWLSKIAFPDVESASLRRQVVSDYEFFYGATVTDVQIDKVLWTDANGDSANYGQFDAA